MWKFTKDKEALLKMLCSCPGPSSNEVVIQKCVARVVSDLGLSVRGDNIGNLYASKGEGKKLNVAVVAHCDEVGMQVVGVEKNGMLRFRKIGGLRPTSLPGHRVVVLTDKGLVDGIVGCDPLLDNETESGYVLKTSDLWIDTCGNSAGVKAGDFVVFREQFYVLNNTCIVSKALDDRVGVFIMLEILRMLNEADMDIHILGISSVQEEIQLRGVRAVSEDIDIAVVIDVDYASDQPAQHKNRDMLSLGGGPGICFNADSNPKLRSMLEEVANNNNIRIQRTVGGTISGGTDASQLQLRSNIATVNVSIPLRYMHTHSEICAIRDVEDAINMITEFIHQIDSRQLRSFIPWK